MDRIAETLLRQEGVISRQQALERGLDRVQVARRLRRGEWVVIHPGVYLNHNGPRSWQQRAWAAVLYAWPAALSHESALTPARGSGDAAGCIHVAVDRQRHLSEPAGVRLRRMADFETRVHWNLGPPRVRYDEAVLDVAAARSDPLGVVAVLADACRSRRTTAARLRERLAARRRISQRDWLDAVLADVANGTCSVLEHGYQARIVRPHGLPAGELQVMDSNERGRVFRDVVVKDLSMIVELDGRLFHSSATDRDHDLERDLDAAVERDATTLRIGFGQVFGRGCATAQKVGAVMTRRGWTGAFQDCGDCRDGGGTDQPA